MKVLTAVVLAAALLFARPVIAQDKDKGGSVNTNMEILMEKVKADKKLLVAANLDLSDEEGKNFWPVYEAYQKELEKQNQQLGKTIMEYADAYNKGPVPDDMAKKLMKQVFSIESAQVKTKHEYAEKVGKVLSASKTARYIQIETKIRAALMYELAKQIPLVE
jgi:hypothetical protein